MDDLKGLLKQIVARTRALETLYPAHGFEGITRADLTMFVSLLESVAVDLEIATESLKEFLHRKSKYV